MEIPELVEYCDANYARGNEKCDSCTNDDCEGSCDRCFNSIHKVWNNRDYDCPNLMHHYVCEYLYAYSSEIWHLFNADNDLKNLDEYRILSIGVGPASELFGISKIADDKPINFVGYDLNRLWGEIHNKILDIASRCQNCSVELNIADVFDEFNPDNFKPNIIVMSYLISHLSKSGCDVDEFMTNLKDKVLDKIERPYYIVINDINLNTARDKFSIIYQKLNPIDDDGISSRCYYFDGYTYGTKHNSSALIEDIPANILAKYQTWQHCKKTAQFLIKVN